MAGVYISYPFCAQKCTYCNFASGVLPREQERHYPAALLREIESVSFPWLPETVYIGGGTPSSMDPQALRRVLAALPGRTWREATLEAAPGTITAENVAAWLDAGLNRISLGVQSFIAPELKRTGRRHTAESVVHDVAMLRNAGLTNINLDLIAGLPGQTAATWSESLDFIARLAPPHVSVYMLEVDNDSRLGQEMLLGGVRYGASDVPDDALIATMYETAVERLAALGICRYEISNFAREGFQSVHNLKYWKREPYLGFGSDAHSFDQGQRWQNTESAAEYIRLSPHARVETTPADELEEKFFVGLRLSEGIETNAADWQRHGPAIRRFSSPRYVGNSWLAPAPHRAGRHALERSLSGIPHRMNSIDLRSDTVTRPTPAMRRAMAEAEVGDDVYGEDPTVNLLERRAAEITGKEAALFVPTGIMGNTIAIKLHTEHGQEVICDARAHLLDWELSMTAWFSGCLVRTVSAPGGVPLWEHFRKALRAVGPHNAATACVEIENTHNMLGGLVYSLADIQEICAESHKLGLKVHMDGARVFNAAEALGVPVARIVKPVDTVMFCLSKALGAPVGSMLAGTAHNIARARTYRKRLGGGMRQAGVLAAAGLIALEEHPAKLKADHAHARSFANAIAGIPGITIDPARVATNIVIFDITGTGRSPQSLSTALKERGVLLNGISDTEMRAVTHYDVSGEQCERAAATLRDVLDAS